MMFIKKGENDEFRDNGESKYANSNGEVGSEFLTGSEAKLAAELIATEMVS
jgi:hypothetical protein